MNSKECVDRTTRIERACRHVAKNTTDPWASAYLIWAMDQDLDFEQQETPLPLPSDTLDVEVLSDMEQSAYGDGWRRGRGNRRVVDFIFDRVLPSVVVIAVAVWLVMWVSILF